VSERGAEGTMMHDTRSSARTNLRERSAPRALPQERTLRLGGLSHQLQLGRQGEGMQVVPLNDGPSSLLSETAVCLGIGEGVHHGVRDRSGVKEIHEQSVFPVAQNFLHGRRSRADHEAARGQRFEHGPGEDEGIREIHVDTGNLEYGEEGRVRHPPQEVHAAEVEGIPELVQYLLPVGLTVGKTHSVAHLISADDDHVSLRVSGKDGRKAAHEGPESTVGLEIARDVRDDLVPNPQLPIVIRQTQVAEGSGFTMRASIPSWTTRSIDWYRSG